MWQMVFANVSIQGWIIDPNIESFFDGSHYTKYKISHNQIGNTISLGTTSA